MSPLLEDSATLEEAAQTCTDAIYAHFGESIALARVFVTVPMKELPMENSKWVEALAERAGVSAGLDDETPVLSLLASSGDRPEWNDRKASQGHVGIPLVSSKFIAEIPMIAQLLNQLGLPLDWVDSRDSNIVKKKLGNAAGMFFVDRASEATDLRDRKIIAAQDFVAEHDIKSVVGVGGAYLLKNAIFVLIIFCHDEIARHDAGYFVPLVNFFKSRTGSLVKPDMIFRTPEITENVA